jgi:Fe-S-cluster containining protein
MCCNEPEVVSINMDDLWRLAERFHSKPMRMAKIYCKRHPTDKTAWALKKVKPCQFYDPERKGCKIYNYRPDICRAYPFISQYFEPGSIKIYPGCQGCKDIIEEFNLNVVEESGDEKGNLVLNANEEGPAVLARRHADRLGGLTPNAGKYTVRALRNTNGPKTSKGAPSRSRPSGTDGL